MFAVGNADLDLCQPKVRNFFCRLLPMFGSGMARAPRPSPKTGVETNAWHQLVPFEAARRPRANKARGPVAVVLLATFLGPACTLPRGNLLFFWAPVRWASALASPPAAARRRLGIKAPRAAPGPAPRATSPLDLGTSGRQHGDAMFNPERQCADFVRTPIFTVCLKSSSEHGAFPKRLTRSEDECSPARQWCFVQGAVPGLTGVVLGGPRNQRCRSPPNSTLQAS